MDISKYSSILECIKLKNIDNINKYTTFINIINKNIQNKKEPLIISLSGGVDSMVLMHVLQKLKKTFVAFHINYNNRNETNLEAEFLRDYCSINRIPFIYESIEIKRGSIKRSDYEIRTKNIRFDKYKQLLSDYKSDCILLGHHRDDVIENIFNNICRGRNILDLSVIKKENIISNVLIVRPMLDIFKIDILSYANYYDIPYFKDTTPDWCLRGIFRRKIYPLISLAYKNNIKENLLSMAEQSTEWNDIIEKDIILPFLNSIEYTASNIKFNIYKHKDYSITFWHEIFIRLFHKYGKNSLSKKSIQNLIISFDKNKTIELSKDTNCIINNYNIIILFK